MIEFIKKVFNISDLSFDEKLLKDIEGLFEIKEFKKNDIVLKEEDKSDFFYIVKSGILKIYFIDSIGEETISLLKEGEVLGEMGFLTENIRTASGMAISDCVLLKLSKKNFEIIKDISPKIAMKIYDKLLFTLSARLKVTTNRLFGRFL